MKIKIVQIDIQGVVMKSEFTWERKMITNEQTSKSNKNIQNVIRIKSASKALLKSTLHKCDICLKVFCSKTVLKEHTESVHLKEEKLFFCDICDKRFDIRAGLTEHNRLIHQGNTKPFKCELCSGKSFEKSHLLRQHLDTVHKKLKNFKCEHCPKCFGLKRLKGNLKKHKKLKPYNCNTCSKSFVFAQNLTIHIQSVHEKLKKSVHFVLKLMHRKKI